MSVEAEARVAQLRAEGERQRAALAGELTGIRGEIEERRSQLRFAGNALTILATAGTVLYKIFGKTSVAYRVGRLASAAGILFQLGRAAFKTRRSW